MEKYLTRALTDRDENMIDGRHIYLHMDFTLSKEGVMELAEKFMQKLIFPLGKNFIYEISTENCGKSSMKKFLDEFQRDLADGFASICMEIYKRTEKISSLAAVHRFENQWYSEDTFLVEEEYKLKQAELKRRIAESITVGTVERDIINKGEYVTDGKPGFSDLSLLFQCDPSDYDSSQIFGIIDFDISVYSLGKNVDAAAMYLTDVLKEFCEMDSNIGGFVSIGVYHASEKKEFFFYYDADYVVLDDGKKLSTKEWMHLNYIDGIEWYNILTLTVAEKLNNRELLKKSEDVIFEELEDGKIVLSSRKSLMSFRAKDWAPVYNCICSCQKPGYGEEKLIQSILLERDLYFAPDEYKIEGDMIYFSRGRSQA